MSAEPSDVLQRMYVSNEQVLTQQFLTVLRKRLAAVENTVGSRTGCSRDICLEELYTLRNDMTDLNTVSTRLYEQLLLASIQ